MFDIHSRFPMNSKNNEFEFGSKKNPVSNMIICKTIIQPTATMGQIINQ